MRHLVASIFIGIALFIVVPSAALACMLYDYSSETLHFDSNGANKPAQIIVEYVANIAPRDLTNSRGERLTNFAAVLQQDRANIHKSGISDDPDGWQALDGYFTNAERRGLLSTADYSFYCDYDQKDIAQLKQQIQSGQVPGWVGVIVFRKPNSAPGVFIQLVR